MNSKIFENYNNDKYDDKIKNIDKINSFYNINKDYSMIKTGNNLNDMLA
jgi:hypothetical protein